MSQKKVLKDHEYLHAFAQEIALSVIQARADGDNMIALTIPLAEQISERLEAIAKSITPQG